MIRAYEEKGDVVCEYRSCCRTAEKYSDMCPRDSGRCDVAMFYERLKDQGIVDVKPSDIGQNGLVRILNQADKE